MLLIEYGSNPRSNLTEPLSLDLTELVGGVWVEEGGAALIQVPVGVSFVHVWLIKGSE